MALRDMGQLPLEPRDKYPCLWEAQGEEWVLEQTLLCPWYKLQAQGN